MREPSSSESRWAWWEAAVAGLNPPIHEREPEVGYYRFRRWPRKQFWLPARIWLEHGEVDPETGELMSDEWLCAEIDGERKNPFAVWTWLQPITEDEWKWLKATRNLQPEKMPSKSSR